jgi:hypothetical protein
MSSKHKTSLYAFTKNSNDPNAHYIKYCEILRNVIKVAKKQRCSRRIAKLITIKTTWNIIKKFYVFHLGVYISRENDILYMQPSKTTIY